MAKRMKPALPDERPRPNRTSPNGCIRFDRDLTRFGVGRLQCSSGTDNPQEFEYRNGVITKLIEDCDIETLTALKDGEISIQELTLASRKGRLNTALQTARAKRGLVEAPPGPATPAPAAPASSTFGGGTAIHPVPGEVTDPARDVWIAFMQMLGTGAADMSGAHGYTPATLLQALRHGIIGSAAQAIDGTPSNEEGCSTPAPGSAPALLLPNSTPESAEERRPLWETLIERVVPLLHCGPETKRRYTVSLESLRRKLHAYESDKTLGELKAGDEKGAPPTDYPELAVETLHRLASDEAKVGDLRGVRREFWTSLYTQWGASDHDWNHMRRAISATLTGLFGYAQHPFRFQVMKAIPACDDGPGRVPDLTPELFWQVVERMPEHARPGPVVLVATGMRMKEYVSTTKSHLMPQTFGIRVPGSKTAGSQATVYVAEALWPWIEAGVPAPLQRKWLTIHWKRAYQEVGLEDIRFHDLRHCLGQWATDAGVPEKSVQWALRHRDPNMTRRYTQTRAKYEVANAMGSILTGQQ